MNRFRAKRKGKDEDGVPRPSQESESPLPFLGFRKGKKVQEEEKKQIDLATVLPSDDSFRTSLLMTGLSARFSMLREQDDPNTKIGKASDDSVLFPKRQSRMDMASFRGLGDIAEVESIKMASPFARIESYHSDDADSSNSGSIMSRAKPTEGNNLFGGRQKVYKLPSSGLTSKGDGVMSSRTLYDNDVSQSAFQKWRLAEKEKQSQDDEPDESETHDEQRDSSADLGLPRSESPSLSGYNQNRETSSTISSIPSIARQSSAATSTTSSQPAPSLKEGQPSNAPSSGPERSVTRTRRLYENRFLNQDSQESADRLSGERRLLAKASAPNLRSTSPFRISPTPAANFGVQVPSKEENTSEVSGASPSTPPISEADEKSLLSINPNDRGKATALGVFQKPAQPYDETRYAQRQLQLQRGREAPTQKTGDEPEPSTLTQPRFAFPTQRGPADSSIVPLFAATQSIKDRAQSTSSQNNPNKGEISPASLPSSDVYLGRPSLEEHPAFRDSAVPTPLSIGGKPLSIPFSTEISPSHLGEPKAFSPLDSPTLGPETDGAGLNLMVRQHLRGDSNASSIYDGMPPTASLDSRFPHERTAPKSPLAYGKGSSPWRSEDQIRDWNLDLDVNEPLPDADSHALNSGKPAETKVSPPSADSECRDEFADRLADEARRIREKLTSRVDVDSRSPSPHGTSEPKSAADPIPPSRPSGLGAILRPRGSKSSLVDRGRDPSSTRALKMIGISPACSRTNSPGSDSPRRRAGASGEFGHEKDKVMSQGAEEQHPGLRAFQQARGELQRIKGLETQSRQYPASQAPPSDVASPQQRTTRQPGAPRARTPSRDRKPSLFHQQRKPSEGSRNGEPPANFHLPSSNDRQRSEPEPSSRTRYHNRVGRPGDGPVSQPPMSPYQQPRPSNPSRMNQLNLTLNDRGHGPHGYESGQAPPMSPGMARQGPPTPTMSPPRPPFAHNHSYDNPIGSVPGSPRHRANSRGVPDLPPSMPHSRIPTNALPQDAGNPSRSNGRSAPSLPPINPRRRQDSTNMPAGSEPFPRRGRDNVEREAIGMPPSVPWDRHGHGERRGTLGSSDENGVPGDMRRPSRPLADAANAGINLNKQRGANPPVQVGSRMISAQGRTPPGHELPGGMF